MLCKETIDVEMNMMVNMAKTMRVENFTRIHSTSLGRLVLAYLYFLET